MPDLILQTNDGKFVSDLINDRYQVLESNFVPGKFYVYDLVSDVIPFREKDNSVTVFNTVDSAMKRINGVKEKRIANSEPVKTVAKKGKTRGESALSYLKSLIVEQGNLSNEEIAKMVKDRFPDSNYNHSMVKFNRKKLAG